MQAQAEHLEGGTGVTIREQILQLLQDNPDLTKAQLARETGISSSAITEYSHGTYKGNNANVERKLVKYLRARRYREREQLTAAETPEFFEGDSAVEILGVLERAQSLGLLGQVCTVPGIGKTTTASEHAGRSTNVWVATCAPYVAAENAALKTIMLAVGASAQGNASLSYADAIKRCLRRSQGLLIVDEAHHLSGKALDSIRTIYDDTRVGIVYMGAPELAVKTARMGQLSSRFSARADIMSPSIGDVNALLDAWEIIEDKQRTFVAGLAKRPGALRTASRVLELATSLAKRAQKPRTLKHVEMAWESLAPQTASDKDAA